MSKICQICIEPSKALSAQIAPLALPRCTDYRQGLDSGFELMLIADKESLVLASSTLGAGSGLKMDFVGGSLGHRRHFGGGRNQDICRAVGLSRQRNLQICDATAGLGRDAFMLSLQGAQVTAYEKNPVLACLIDWARRQALVQASKAPDEELHGVMQQLTFIKADSTTELTPEGFDVVYLDPMFPERAKSAKVKKEMQILHQLLEGEGSDPKVLFESCWSAARSRLVIKRPVKAPLFAEQKPSHQVVGKAIRYDVYVRSALP